VFTHLTTEQQSKFQNEDSLKTGLWVFCDDSSLGRRDIDGLKNNEIIFHVIEIFIFKPQERLTHFLTSQLRIATAGLILSILKI
jgi:hypothetical protein